MIRVFDSHFKFLINKSEFKGESLKIIDQILVELINTVEQSSCEGTNFSTLSC